MNKIYIVIGHDYDYTDVFMAFKSEEIAKSFTKTLNDADNGYLYTVNEVQLLE